MALDVVLRGVSAARLATILASFHGEGIAQIVVSATDAENRVRGAESWNQVKGQSVDRLANIEVCELCPFRTGCGVIAKFQYTVTGESF